MTEEVYKDNELQFTFTSYLAQSLCEFIYLSTFNKEYKIKYKPNYTDKMEVEVRHQEYKFIFKNVPCHSNHIDMSELFKEEK